MDMNRRTVKLQEALQAASAQAMRRNHQGIDVEHVLLALLEQEGGLTGPLLEQAGVCQAAVRKAAEQALAKVPQVQGCGAGPGQIQLTARFSQVLARPAEGMQALRDEYMGGEHVPRAVA